MTESVTTVAAPAAKKPRAPRKPSVIGFIILDEGTKRPLVFRNKSLLEVADEAMFFEITVSKHKESIKSSPRSIEYQMGKGRAESVLRKHNANLSKLRSSSITIDCSKVTEANKLRPKIIAVKRNPADAAPVEPTAT